MKKIGVLVVLIILISPISFALEAGKLYINNVFIPFEAKTVEKSQEPEKAKSTFYIYANGQRIAKKTNNKLYYFYNDHLGSPRAISDDEGNIIWKADYLPFGEMFNELNSNNKINYNSKELDFDTKLHYYGARYYLDDIGRFITADTVEMFPNAYVYTANNPLKFVDLRGEQKGEPLYNTIVLISSPTKSYEKVAYFLGLNSYIRKLTRKINMINPIIVKGATSRDFFEALKEEWIENIVIIGHGGPRDWRASDKSVHQFEVEDFLEENKGFKPKKNLFKFTCGGEIHRMLPVPGELELIIKRNRERMEGYNRLKKEYSDPRELKHKKLLFRIDLNEKYIDQINQLRSKVNIKDYQVKVPPFGTGIFENIYYWERATAPLDFYFDPYHKTEGHEGGVVSSVLSRLKGS